MLVPCYPSGVIYDLLECLYQYIDSAGLSSIPFYFISPVANSSLEFSQIFAEWYVSVLSLSSTSVYLVSKSKNNRGFLQFLRLCVCVYMCMPVCLSDQKTELLKVKSLILLEFRSISRREWKRLKLLCSQNNHCLLNYLLQREVPF